MTQTKRQITEDELWNILELISSSDNEIKILGISLLNCYDWTGLKETQNRLFWIVFAQNIIDRTEPIWICTLTYSSYKDGRLLDIIEHWNYEKKNRSKII